jgi:hypothetical protein
MQSPHPILRLAPCKSGIAEDVTLIIRLRRCAACFELLSYGLLLCLQLGNGSLLVLCFQEVTVADDQDADDRANDEAEYFSPLSYGWQSHTYDTAGDDYGKDGSDE